MLVDKGSYYFLFAYFFVVIVEAFAIFTQNKILEFISKPFLIVLLFTMYMRFAKIKNYYYIAILFLLGFVDFALIQRNTPFYLYTAIITLIITHILYIKIFYKRLVSFSKTKLALYFSPFLLCLGIVFSIAQGMLGAFFYLLFIHIFLLFFVTNIVFLEYLQKNKKHSLLLLLSFLTLVFANFLFAFNVFFNMSVYILIISTFFYTIAQYVICRVMIYKSKL